MSIAVWPSVMLVGAWMLAVGAVVALLGGVAGIANNEGLADLLIVRSGVPMVVVSAVVFFIGLGGWWTILLVSILIGFGWLVRPSSTRGRT